MGVEFQWGFIQKWGSLLLLLCSLFFMLVESLEGVGIRYLVDCTVLGRQLLMLCLSG